MSGWRRYAEVLRGRDVLAALSASLVGRVSLAMNGLALLLLTREVTGSYAQAGLVAGANGIAFAVVAPRWAREADRRGASTVLRFSAVAHPAAMVLFVVLALADAPGGALIGCGALIGATDPPLGSVMRAGWARVVEPRLLRTAYSLESVTVELCFISGPLLVALLVALAHPALAVLVSAAFSGAGTLRLAQVAFVRERVLAPPVKRHVAGPLVSPVVRAVLIMLFFVGMGFGTAEVAVIAFVEEQGSSRAIAGLVLATWSLGSLVGGLVYGGLHLASHSARQLPVIALSLAAVSVLPMTAGSVGSLTVLMALYGLAIAPFFACQSLVLGESAPEGTVTEAFAWTSSMIFAGAAGGAALAGLVIEAGGARDGLQLTAVAGLLCGLVVLASLTSLRRIASTSAASG